VTAVENRTEIGPAPLDAGPEASPYTAAADMRRLGMAMWSSAIIQAAGELRLADHLGEEPKTVAELAAATGADEDALLRLLRALAAHGIFAPVGEDSYTHTPASQSLRSDQPGNVLYLNLLGAAEWNWLIWSRLTESIRSGNGVFHRHYGKDLYRYFNEDNPGAGDVFNKAMTESGHWTSQAVAQSLDLTGVGTVADVGGGQGGLLKTLLEANPNVSGVLIDRPQVVGYANPALREGGELADRVTIAAADIRESVPAAADVYILRQVAHVWKDDVCVQILRNAAEKAAPGARLVLVEHVVEEATPNSTYTTLVDLQMMLLDLGKERTEREFAELMAQAGWEFTGVTQTRSPLALVEGRRIG
jgi:C-methyltransferase